MNSSLTGSGTLNLVANYVRYPLSGNWSGFTGQINVTGAGFQSANANTVGAFTSDIDELRINNTNGYANAAIYLYALASYNGPTPIRAGDVPDRRAVARQLTSANWAATTTAILGTGTASAGNTTWSVGWKNTTNTFAGVIANDAQKGVGVTSITKMGTGKWIFGGGQHL